MLDFNSVMIGTHRTSELASFYEKVLGRAADWSDGEWSGWKIGSANLTIGPHSEVKGKAKEPQRVILNFETKEVKKEFERMKKAGAKVVAEPYEMGGGWIATLADPDGNYFQLVSPWEEESSSNKKTVN